MESKWGAPLQPLGLGPHLVVVPLSVLTSWVLEFRRFCPAHHAALTRAGLSTATGAESCGAACVRRTAASAAAAVPLVRAGLPITVTG